MLLEREDSLNNILCCVSKLPIDLRHVPSCYTAKYLRQVLLLCLGLFIVSVCSAHHSLIISAALDLALRDSICQLLYLFRREVDVNCSSIFLQILHTLGSRNGKHIIALQASPSLSWCCCSSCHQCCKYLILFGALLDMSAMQGQNAEECCVAIVYQASHLNH